MPGLVMVRLVYRTMIVPAGTGFAVVVMMLMAAGAVILVVGMVFMTAGAFLPVVVMMLMAGMILPVVVAAGAAVFGLSDRVLHSGRLLKIIYE